MKNFNYLDKGRIIKIMSIFLEILIGYNLIKAVMYLGNIPKELLLVYFISTLFLNSVLYRIENSNNYALNNCIGTACIMMVVCVFISIFVSNASIVWLSITIGMSLGIAMLVMSIINSKSKINIALRVPILICGIVFLFIA